MIPKTTCFSSLAWLLALLVLPALAAAQQMPPAQVVVAPVGQQQVAENTPFLGLVYYQRVSQVSPEVAGLAREVLFREGDELTAGQPLVRLDLELLEQEIRLSENRMAQVEVRLAKARKDFDRLASLYQEKGVSEKQYDDVRFALQDLQQEKAALATRHATLLLQRQKSTIRAPYHGIVLAKEVEVGDWVQPGRAVARLGALAHRFVKVPVAETLLPFITPGERVQVVLTASGQELTADIDSIAPVADSRTKNITVKIRLPELKGSTIAENMSATVYLPSSAARTLAILPRDALIKFQGKDFVYTVKENKAAILPVTIVTYLADTVAAADPYFQPGMPVVIEGNERLRPDQPVQIVSGSHIAQPQGK